MIIEDVIRFFWNHGDATIKNRSRKMITHFRDRIENASKTKTKPEVESPEPDICKNRISLTESNMNSFASGEKSALVLPLVTPNCLGTVELFNEQDETDVFVAFITALETKPFGLLDAMDANLVGLNNGDELRDHLLNGFLDVEFHHDVLVTMIEFDIPESEIDSTFSFGANGVSVETPNEPLDIEADPKDLPF
ncbi:hypothetical protein KAR91_50310 [Candidatus Pacearchaeota archaeon]|nr:hypothetical protein [Candidatus Pacearchaeota archaeon]